MKRYRITLSYLGTAYCGWQNQKNGLSVQEVVEKAFGRLFGRETAVTASGRTDAGVHAEAQVAHLDADTSIPAEKIPFAVNTLLPEDIRVLSCEEAPDDFHARFSAKEKTYRYSVYASRHSAPLENTAVHVTGKLDLDEMRRAAAFIEGRHDFRCFEASGSEIRDTVRTVKEIRIEERGRITDIFVTADGFLYNMVRIIAGTLVSAAKGKIPADEIPEIILSGDRTRAGKTLPAKGLTLIGVKYE